MVLRPIGKCRHCFDAHDVPIPACRTRMVDHDRWLAQVAVCSRQHRAESVRSGQSRDERFQETRLIKPALRTIEYPPAEGYCKVCSSLQSHTENDLKIKYPNHGYLISFQSSQTEESCHVAQSRFTDRSDRRGCLRDRRCQYFKEKWIPTGHL